MQKGSRAIGLFLSILAIDAAAEIVEIDDLELSNAVAQSGLLLEIGFGGGANKASITNVDWSNSGITVDAFKWEVDLEAYDSTGNAHTNVGVGAGGGFVAEGILLAGQLDILVTATGNAIGLDFKDTNIDMRVSNMAAYSGVNGLGESMGAIEVLSLNIDGMDVFISGRGASNP